MLEIFINEKYKSEKFYVIDYLFSEFLDYKHNINIHKEKNYKIKFRDKEINMPDIFLDSLDSDNYFDKNNIPEKISFLHHPLTFEDDLPVFFGNPEIYFSEKMIRTSFDIIGTIFFFLSLYHEEVHPEYTDEHGRFDENKSFLIKNKLNLRPVVNEYIELLEAMLKEFKYDEPRAKRHLRVFLTHDVDFLLKYNNVFKFLYSASGDILKRRSFKKLQKTCTEYKNYLLKRVKDPYDTYDYLMDVAETKGLKCRFYFMSCKRAFMDCKYSVQSLRLMRITNNILRRGHHIGVHPSYNAAFNEKKFLEEVAAFKDLHVDLKEMRMHYLRFKNPVTWDYMNKSRLLYDSSVAYSNNIGFRAGICSTYNVFRFDTRTPMFIRERPLSIMDKALKNLTDNREEAIEISKTVIDTIKKYNGDFVILWHNSNLNINGWENWHEVYEQIVDYL